jgi:multicomponent Na+:H+ antiporter subunit D
MEGETNLPQAMLETATAAADWVIILPMALALMGSALLLMLRKSRGFNALLAMLVVIAIIACEAVLFGRVVAEGPLSMTMGNWLPPFGISFTADIYGAGFALASSVVTLIVIAYMQMDREPGDNADGQLAMVLLLLAGVTGSFLTGDFFNLYVWFEVMLIASFGLLVLGGSRLQLDGAVKYGFINFLATTFFLMALGLTYALLGTLNMADIIGKAPQANQAALAGITALLILAFGMKAAAFPVNAWLPASYHAPPAAVSALFAGLLTKVGVFALLRSSVVLFPQSRELLEPVLVAVATATLIIAPLGAIAETNLRRAIGFILIGGIGVIFAGIGMASARGIAGAGFYIFHAILTMTALYLVAGLIERVTGETDSRRMGGLYAANSPLSILFFVLVLAAAGVPPFLGFWPKLLLIEAGLEQAGTGADWDGIQLVGALLINAFLTLIAGTRLWAHIFWRAGREGAQSEYHVQTVGRLSRKETWLGLGATMVLVGGIALAGLLPNALFEVMQDGAADLVDPSRYIAAVGLAPGEASP